VIFRLNQIVRYSDGPTALFKITSILTRSDKRATRYYGIHCMGGGEGAFHLAIQPATKEDLATWRKTKKWRKRGWVIDFATKLKLDVKKAFDANPDKKTDFAKVNEYLLSVRKRNW